MVMTGRSVNLPTLNLEGLDLLSGYPILRAHTFDSTDNCPSSISGGRNESMLPNPGPLALESDAG